MAIVPSMSGRFKPGPVFYSELFKLSYNTPVWYDVILSYDKQGKPYIRTGRNESLGKTSSYPEYKDAESCARIFIGYIPYEPVEDRDTIKSNSTACTHQEAQLMVPLRREPHRRRK